MFTAADVDDWDFIEFKWKNQIIIEKAFAISKTFATFVVKYDESDFFRKEESWRTDTDISTHRVVYIAV